MTTQVFINMSHLEHFLDLLISSRKTTYIEILTFKKIVTMLKFLFNCNKCMNRVLYLIKTDCLYLAVKSTTMVQFIVFVD